MPIDIRFNARGASRARWYSDRRLFLDADGRVVGDKDPRRVTLLVSEGGSIDLEVAERLGLTGEAAPQIEQADPGDESDAKAIESAPADKAVCPERNKTEPRTPPVRERKPK